MAARQDDWHPDVYDGTKDPYEELAGLRSECPVAWTNDGPAYWTITRHEDVTAAARDTERFSNVPRHPRIGTMYTPPLEADRPVHTAFRRALNPYFRPDYLIEKEPRIRAVAVSMLGDASNTSELDFSTDFCQQYPARVLCDLIGVPQKDWADIQGWTETSFLTHRDRGDDPEKFLEANLKINEYGAALIREARLGANEGSIISGLVKSQIAQESFSDEEIFGLVRLLLQAGHSTTAMSLANVVHALASNEEHQRLLRGDAALIPPFIQEVLRTDTAVMGNLRRVRENTVFQGREMLKGEHVLLSWASANHDPDAFENPDEFSLERDPRMSLTFGHGIHRCPGMPLALLEIRVAVEELLRRTSSIRHSGPITRKAWEANGVKHLPVTVDWL